MGFCDNCNKYRQLRFLVSYASGTRVVRAVCIDCLKEEKYTVIR